jgi:tetratricopeptide (TPR) repeat protein
VFFRIFGTMAGAFLSAALLSATAAPVAAEPLPRLEDIGSPQERAAHARLFALVTAGTEARSEPLPELDRILQQTPEPTALRGLIQFYRAGALFDKDRATEARDAVEESVRLLPRYSGPLILAAMIEAYYDRPSPGADYLLRAAAIDPAAVRDVDDFDLGNLVSRLRARHDEPRLNLLAARLFEIGWRGGDLELRSGLARDLIRIRVRAGDIEGARALLPNLTLPSQARDLLTEKAYQSVWPEIETWAGPQQSRQWQTYLTETRARWEASRDPRLAVSFAHALAAANHNATLARELLPVLMGRLDRERDYYLLWTVAPVASALARLGRWDEADALFVHTLAVWPLGSDANALNLAANCARLLLYRGRAAEALAAIDAVIADAGRWPGHVSPTPLAAMHFVRACALHRLGPDSATLSSVALAANTGSVPTAVETYLCLERPEAARTVLLDALAREELRGAVADFLQPEDRAALPGELGGLLDARRAALRGDPVLLEAAAPHVRILPYSGRAGAPAETTGP